jgi:phosphoglycolate phosphatase-like HAD superfamily hydrolase
MEPNGLLVLFDCSGTLLVGEDELTQPALVEALDRLTGCDIPADTFDELDRSARPARWLAQETVDRSALPQVDLDVWLALAARLYLDRAGKGTPAGWAAAEGAAQALGELERESFRLALLTGIPERIARDRLDRVGLERFFPRGQGAFGCEDADREELLALALERASTPPQRAVHVGDTSRDSSSARAVGLHCIAVAHDDDPPRSGRDAPDTVGSMPGLVAALRDLRSSLSNGHRKPAARG